MADRGRLAAVAAASVGVLSIASGVAYAAYELHGPGNALSAGIHPGSEPGPDTELMGSATVIESPSHGPEFCLGIVLDSYPPQCSGPHLVGWNWAAVAGEERSGETVFGDYVVIGTYDPGGPGDGTFTPTRPPVPADDYAEPTPPVDRPNVETMFLSPCDPPQGGWAVLDPDTTSEGSLQETYRVAESLDGFAADWADRSINPAWHVHNPEPGANDPAKLILNVSTTGDVDATELTLRQTWGGPLCVSRAEHSADVLDSVGHQVCDVDVAPGVFVCGTSGDEVDLDVIYDDGTLQQRLDDQYGDGVVRVSSALQPYPAP